MFVEGKIERYNGTKKKEDRAKDSKVQKPRNQRLAGNLPVERLKLKTARDQEYQRKLQEKKRETIKSLQDLVRILDDQLKSQDIKHRNKDLRLLQLLQGMQRILPL